MYVYAANPRCYVAKRRSCCEILSCVFLSDHVCDVGFSSMRKSGCDVLSVDSSFSFFDTLRFVLSIFWMLLVSHSRICVRLGQKIGVLKIINCI